MLMESQQRGRRRTKQPGPGTPIKSAGLRGSDRPFRLHAPLLELQEKMRVIAAGDSFPDGGVSSEANAHGRHSHGL